MVIVSPDRPQAQEETVDPDLTPGRREEIDTAYCKLIGDMLL